jgi:hypothetical protein
MSINRKCYRHGIESKKKKEEEEEENFDKDLFGEIVATGSNGAEKRWRLGRRSQGEGALYLPCEVLCRHLCVPCFHLQHRFPAAAAPPPPPLSVSLLLLLLLLISL